MMDPNFRWRSSQGLAVAGVIALSVYSIHYESYRQHMAKMAALANVDKSPGLSQFSLPSHQAEEFLNNLSLKIIKRVEKKLAKLGEPQPGMPYSLPDVLHRLNAISFPGNTSQWEVYSEKYTWKMNVTEAGIRYWANQVREAHIMDLGTRAFAVSCILALNKEDYIAVELLWGWKVFLGADYSDRKSRCWRTSYTLREMRTLASVQRSCKFTLDFVDEINDMCGE